MAQTLRTDATRLQLFGFVNRFFQAACTPSNVPANFFLAWKQNGECTLSYHTLSYRCGKNAKKVAPETLYGKPITFSIGFTLLDYRIWIRDVFWLVPPAPKVLGSDSKTHLTYRLCAVLKQGEQCYHLRSTDHGPRNRTAELPSHGYGHRHGVPGACGKTRCVNQNGATSGCEVRFFLAATVTKCMVTKGARTVSRVPPPCRSGNQGRGN